MSGFPAWQAVRTSPGEQARWNEARTLAPGELPSALDAADGDWWLRTHLEVDAPAWLEFAGLTFPAEVFVDGAAVAECESMFLPVRMRVDPGRHEVVVRFGSLSRWLADRRPRGRWRSSLTAAQGLRWARTTLLGHAPVYGDVPIPVGCWRPVRLVPAGELVDITITADPGTGTVRVDGSADGPVRVTVLGPDGSEISSAAGTLGLSVVVPDPQLWWPRGYGDQPLYRAVVTVGDTVLADRTFGFRTVSVDQSGGAWQLAVNDVPVFCRGAAWTPPDPVRLSVPDDVVRQHLSQLGQRGTNMVRVVGGMVYEQPAFYDCCAELGLLVWQDAMLATFDPPRELDDVIAREVTTLLAAHSGNPALAVLSGGSETLQRPEMLGIRAEDRAVPVIDQVLRDVVAPRGDVVYVRSSPAPPDGSDHLAIRPDSGVAHWFGVGGYLRPVADVRSAGVRFAAECLAFANPPSPAAVERHFGSAAVAGHHPDWKAGVPRDRGASWDFEDVRDFYVREVFGVDPLAVRRADPERYLQLGRMAVAEAMGRCFSFWRQPGSGCAGALVLSSKDLMPGAGWGLLDVDGAAKAALDVLARVWEPVGVTVCDAGQSGVRIGLHNDSGTDIGGELRLQATDVRGSVVVDAKCDVLVPAHSARTWFDHEITGEFRDLSGAFGFGAPVVDGIDVRWWLPHAGRSARECLVTQPRPGQSASVLRATALRSGPDRFEIEVSADIALRYVTLELPGWTLSDNAFHLLAGVPYTVSARGSGAAPVGWVSSVDTLAPVSVTVPQ